MSIKRIKNNSVGIKGINSANEKVAAPAASWVRDKHWLTTPTVLTTDEKIILLIQVPFNQTAIALGIYGDSCSVDWGDGTSGTLGNAAITSHQYTVGSGVDVSTAWPAEFNTPSNIVSFGVPPTETGIPYSDGDIISFANVDNPACAIKANTPYYVINSTSTSCQLSLTSGGAPISFEEAAEGRILDYWQAIITITPSSPGNHIDQFFLRYDNSGAKAYVSELIASLPYSTPYLNNSILGLFAGNAYAELESVIIKSVGTRTSAQGMFEYCTGLKHVDLSAIPVGTLTSTVDMFNNCNSLESISLFDTSNVTNMSYMFDSCSKLTTVPLFNTSSVTDMSYMFNSCTKLVSVPEFNTSSATDMTYMFFNCQSLVTVPSFNTSSVTTMDSMFFNCYSLASVPLFNTSNVTIMYQMFGNCRSLESVPLFDTSSATDLVSMFDGCKKLKFVPLLDTSSALDMNGMFAVCESLTSVPLFNTATVTNMGTLFSGCISLTDVPLFNTSNVTDMSSMFRECKSLTTVPLFDTSSVTNMYGMFAVCESLTSVPLFDTSSVTDMRNMFNSCTNLTQVPLFNTSSVTDFDSMFSDCKKLTRVPAYNMVNVYGAYGFIINSGVSYVDAYGATSGYIELYYAKLGDLALDNFYTNLGTTVDGTIDVSGNYGVFFDDPSIATAKGWTVIG